jgi:adenylosuccinate lyase
MADFANVTHRAHKRLWTAVRQAGVAKLSGPVGDYKVITPSVEAEFARFLGLRRPLSATQVVPRDFYADLVWACSQAATLVERLALEVRLSQQTEVGELREARPGTSPVGSSAMPHKRNPIVSEQLTGLAKLVRAQVVPVQEGLALWHERDISHSSVERVALWGAITLTHYMLTKADALIEGLEVDAARMIQNATHLNHGAVVSSAARSWLVANGLTDPQIAWNLMHRAADLAEADPGTGNFHHHAFQVVSGWCRSPKVQERFPDFNPDWHAFSAAMELTNQVSQHDTSTFRQLEGLLKIATRNFLTDATKEPTP